jgi:hypothetical protein
MKNSLQRILLLLAVVGLTLSSCKKNEASPSSKDLIIGKWKAVSEEWKDYTNNTLTDSGSETIDYDLFDTFRTDGTVIEEDFESLSYNSTTYDYEVVGDKLIISDDSGYYDEFTITELTRTTLKIKAEWSDTLNGAARKYIRIMVLRRVS